ncbi:probable maleylacetoacetate isomerase 2 [Sycon ciliatum]|uniref:probable maleylacetoacetate isomerase 2 n=1 Tax=Sycon ciliatum TaxID=27933 RepID=UPI0020A94D54|eukprot:scpid100902/ scgid30613/ Probable maleylacetoacetate isomerase 2
MATKPVLWSYFRSSCSWRVRIALALKGIEYDQKHVNLIRDGGEQHKDDYVKLNPQQQVPSIEIDGVTLSQSIAILEYLEETRPQVPILPKGAVERARVRHVVECINSGIQPIQNLSILQYVGSEKKAEWGKHWITVGFVALEALLQRYSGKYSVGDEITVADLCLVPQVYNANRFKVDMEAFPAIQRVHSALECQDAFVAAHPKNQPDCPEDLR